MPTEPVAAQAGRFVEAFEPDLRSVAEAVLAYLVKDTGVPALQVRADARLCDELRVCEEDLDDVVIDVAAKLKRVLPSPAELVGASPVVTVRDVVVLIAGMRRA